jgi:iron-sulfur cluster assembly protein
MFEVSGAALKVLAEYLIEQNINSVIRITPMAGHCAGPHLRISVCEKLPNDVVLERDEIVFVINKELLAECGSISVDYIESSNACCCSGGCAGFRISGEKKFLFSGRCTTEPNRCDLRCGMSSPPPQHSLL